MNSRAKVVNPLDHVLHHTLRRQVERLGAHPGPEVRHQLLERAAAQSGRPRWLGWLLDEVPDYRPSPSTALEIGWRELACMSVFRPVGVFSAFSGSLR